MQARLFLVEFWVVWEKYSNVWYFKNNNDCESACEDLDRDVHIWNEIDKNNEFLVLFDSNV